MYKIKSDNYIQEIIRSLATVLGSMCFFILWLMKVAPCRIVTNILYCIKIYFFRYLLTIWLFVYFL